VGFSPCKDEPPQAEACATPILINLCVHIAILARLENKKGDRAWEL
jgi:hypothetical protein